MKSETVANQKSFQLKTNAPCRFTYAIFPTPKGKTYGCFAIERQSENQYKVSVALFAYNADRQMFSKKGLRLIAKNRLNSQDFCVVVDSDKNNYRNIVVAACKKLPNIAPYIVQNIEDGHFEHTLSTDRLSGKQLIDGKQIVINEFYKKVFSNESIKSVTKQTVKRLSKMNSMQLVANQKEHKVLIDFVLNKIAESKMPKKIKNVVEKQLTQHLAAILAIKPSNNA